MSENKETLYIIQKIESFQSEEKRDVIEESRRKLKFRRNLIEENNNSLVLLNEFNKFLETHHLIKSELNEYDQETQEFMDFVLNDRIKKELTYKFIVNLNSKYLMLSFPECSKRLIYKNFILFKTTIKNIENEMINYLIFIKNSEVMKSVDLSTNIHCYLKINPAYNFVNEIIEKFSYSDKLRLYRIKFEYREEVNEYFNNCDILTGKEASYLSSNGTASDLNYILFVKDYFNRFV